MSNAESKRPDRILVLSGGGGRGAYQVGACEVLYERGWTPDVILGNSIGATNGAILAAPRSKETAGIDGIQLLKQVWLNEIAGNKLHKVSDEWPALLGTLIRWGVALVQRIQKSPQPSFATGPAAADDDRLDDLVDALVDDLYGPGQSFAPSGEGAIKPVVKRLFARIEHSIADVLTQSSVMDRQSWAELLEKHVDLDRLNDAGSGCPYLGVTAVKAATGELSYAWNRVPPGVNDTSTEIAVRHLMASSSIPGIYPATEIGWVHWWDGALGANTPVAPAIDVLLHNLPAVTEIAVVSMTPYEEATIGGGAPPTLLDALQRFLDWMMLACLHKELCRLDAEQRAWVRIVAPRAFMGVVQIIDYGEEDVEALIELGRQDAERALGR
jgi:NTE family protein